MKQLKNLLLIIPVVLGVISCNTDDLKNDIDSLKDRVTNLESQVQLLNENLNALRVLAEGGKTIQSYTFDETTGKYTVKLSDGSEIFLTQGTKGEATTPTITISEDGYWVINGEKQATKAEGSDAATPKFRINSEGYWQVDLDGDGPKDFENVLNEKSEPVKATTDQSISMSDEFFDSVKEENGCLVVILKDGGKTYSLPIVENLVCEIVEPEQGFKDGVLTVGFGKIVELTVKVKGDNYAVTAPAGWTAVLGEPDAETNEAKLSIVAPAQASASSRATADNTRDLTLQVNSGLNWAIDKIQVEAKNVIESYYTEYLNGKDLVIGRVGTTGISNEFVLNIQSCPKDMVVYIDSDQEITEDNKVYFVKGGVNVTYNAGKINTLIIIGDNPESKPTIKTTKVLSLSGTESGKGIILYNIVLDASEHSSYVINIDGNTEATHYDYLYLIDNCRIKLPTVGKNFAYINAKNLVDVSNIIMCNTYVNVPVAGNPIMASISGDYKFKDVVIYNNVFYSPKSGTGIEKFAILAAAQTTSSLSDINILNNTFINLLGGNVYAKSVIKGTLNVKNNLIWNDFSSATNTYIFQAIKESDLSKVTSENYSGNKLYSKNNLKASVFHTSGNVPDGLSGNNLENEITDPFINGTFSWEYETFEPGAGYETIGAHIE